jgi:hypothetical protein
MYMSTGNGKRYYSLALYGRAILSALVLALSSGGERLFAQGQNQQPAYVFLGNARSYDRVPGGVMLRADHGSMLIEAIAGVGMRVRVRFSDGTLTFPTPHSLATGDSPPQLGTATVREEGDAVIVSGEGIVVRAARNPVRC